MREEYISNRPTKEGVCNKRITLSPESGWVIRIGEAEGSRGRREAR